MVAAVAVAAMVAIFGAGCGAARPYTVVDLQRALAGQGLALDLLPQSPGYPVGGFVQGTEVQVFVFDTEAAAKAQMDGLAPLRVPFKFRRRNVVASTTYSINASMRERVTAAFVALRNA